MAWRSLVTGACLLCGSSLACSSANDGSIPGDGVDTSSAGGGSDTSSLDAKDAGASLDGNLDAIGDAPSEAAIDASRDGDAATTDADALSSSDDLDGNRDRLLGTYFDYLKGFVTTPQSNGLSGSTVTSVCDLWKKLDPSSQAVFLTLTARMQGSRLRVDGSSMLSHVVKVYRIVGGEGATASSAGSCGGGEFNRMIMSMDSVLHTSQIAASDHKGAKQSDGKFDIGDVVAASFWRDSHDLGGAHAPFDTSDETDQGAPRGQTQYFKDSSSTVAKSALGRQDLMTLVDPLALEMDQDYDCVHNSNPSCSYITYGPACFPEASKTGVDIYTASYGTIEPSWKPIGCGP